MHLSAWANRNSMTSRIPEKASSSKTSAERLATLSALGIWWHLWIWWHS